VSTLGTLATISTEAAIPPSGAWLATCVLDASSLPPLGPTVLTIGDLALVGQVIRRDFDDHPGGARVVAVVRGGAGWRLPVAHEGVYGAAGPRDDSGTVKLSTVLQDLATMAGEGYAAPADRSLGTGYRWEMHAPLAPVHGSTVLADLVWRGFLPTWRVEPFTGLTRFDVWPAIGAADGRGRITGRARAQGRRTVGLDVVVAAFLPGATLEGTTIARAIIRETAADLCVEVFDR
jgi:hypothetical protein